MAQGLETGSLNSELLLFSVILPRSRHQLPGELSLPRFGWTAGIPASLTYIHFYILLLPSPSYLLAESFLKPAGHSPDLHCLSLSLSMGTTVCLPAFWNPPCSIQRTLPDSFSTSSMWLAQLRTSPTIVSAFPITELRLHQVQTWHSGASHLGPRVPASAWPLLLAYSWNERDSVGLDMPCAIWVLQ